MSVIGCTGDGVCACACVCVVCVCVCVVCVCVTLTGEDSIEKDSTIIVLRLQGEH